MWMKGNGDIWSENEAVMLYFSDVKSETSRLLTRQKIELGKFIV